MIVSVLDYGAGNIHSLCKALERDDVELRVDTDPLGAAEADALVLPGVGGFSQGAEHIAPVREALRERIAVGLPTLGVCLGMQLLFESSEEGPGRGLAIAGGRVARLRAERVPQIGWNVIERSSAPDPLFSGDHLQLAYFANSFVCRDLAPDVTVLAWTTHESDRFPSAIRVGSAVGVQFHPEKSSREGVLWIQRWLDEVVARRSALAGMR